MASVRHQGTKNIYVQNDLMQAAHHFKLLIEEKKDDESYEGIQYDYMACLTMLAFALEAQINFIGFKCINNWNEKEPFHTKMDAVISFLGIDRDKKVRPFSSLERLKQFRDSVAHGKPEETEFDEVMEGEKFDRRLELIASWDEYCTDELVRESYDDLDVFWKMMIDASPLEPNETLTNGDALATYLRE